MQERIELTLRDEPPTVKIDAAAVMAQIEQLFPETQRLPGDPFDHRIRATELFFKEHATEAAAAPLRSAIRLAARAAPAYVFLIPQSGRAPIRGVARCDCVWFDFDEPPLATMRQRIVEFLRSFKVGQVEVDAHTLP